MENEEQRNEYVLNEDGHIWRGSARWFRPKPWTFGQVQIKLKKLVSQQYNNLAPSLPTEGGNTSRDQCLKPHLKYFAFHFFQFEDVALDSALWLLDKAGFLGSNPIDISRALSAMVGASYHLQC